jgi:hypothetical protein
MFTKQKFATVHRKVFSPLDDVGVARACVRMLLLVVLCVAGAEFAHAFTFSSDEGNFSAEFPDQPKLEKTNQSAANGIAFDQYIWGTGKGDAYYAVSMDIYTKPVKEEYDGPTNGVVSAVKGKLINQQSFRLQGMSGREIFVEAQGVVLRDRLLWVNGRLYQFLFSGPPGMEKTPAAEAFLNSVHIGK